MKFSEATEQARKTPGLSTGASVRVGNLTIGFGGAEPNTGRANTAGWTEVAANLEWRLWMQPASAGWSGFPVVQIDIPGWQIWLLGELYGESRGAGVARQIAEVVRGERSASALNGHLLLWAWNENRRQWHVWTDRFATLHAYHARHGRSASLGTSFRSVAGFASRRQLDWAGLSGFFGCGFFPGDRTFYDDARVLRPATHHVFGAQGEEVSAQRYWDWIHQPDLRRSYDDTVEEFGVCFGQVMKELLADGRVAIPISGGLDSRSTVAAIAASPSDSSSSTPARFWSYSYGYSKDSAETRISREVAKARGLPFTGFTIQPYLFDRLDQVLEAVEGFQDVTQCRQACVADALLQNANHVVAAHWGDVWMDDMGLMGGERQGATREEGTIHRAEAEISDHTLKKMAKRGRGWLLENICAPRLGQGNPEVLLREFTAAGLNDVRQIEEPDFRVKAFKTDNWSFRWTLASIRMFQAGAFPRLPFYDTRLCNFFGTVPSEFLAGRRLQVDFLKRFAPDLARVKWQAHDADLYTFQNKKAWRWPNRIVGKASRILSGKKVIERNWEVQFSGEQGEAGLKRWLLRPGLRLHELVSEEKIKTLLNDFRADPLKEGRGYTVSMLLTFSAWLEQNV